MTTTFPHAPLPRERELKARTSLLRQAFRFAVLNLKMITMVTKGHH
jgi:hypothetical protein